MDIHFAGLRDRRIAAADENVAGATSEGGSPRQIYSRGSAERTLSLRRGRRGFDVRQIDPRRQLNRINTVFLHQTGFRSGDSLPKQSLDGDITSDHRLDRVIAHFVVRATGEVIYLRDIERGLNSVSARRGIDIEFEGNYNELPEGFRHRDWPDLEHPLAPRLSTRAISRGRRLLSALRTHPDLNIQFIHPHSQVTAKYCPGPDIWMNLGEWAISQFGWSSARSGLREINRQMIHSAYIQHGSGSAREFMMP